MGFVPGLGKSIRTGTLAAVLAVSGSGALMAADCGSVSSWTNTFNNNGYHDCDGTPDTAADIAACAHLSYVNECCLQGSATAQTQTCVEQRCIASVFVAKGSNNPLPASGDCDNP